MICSHFFSNNPKLCSARLKLAKMNSRDQTVPALWYIWSHLFLINMHIYIVSFIKTKHFLPQHYFWRAELGSNFGRVWILYNYCRLFFFCMVWHYSNTSLFPVCPLHIFSQYSLETLRMCGILFRKCYLVIICFDSSHAVSLKMLEKGTNTWELG